MNIDDAFTDSSIGRQNWSNKWSDRLRSTNTCTRTKKISIFFEGERRMEQNDDAHHFGV